MDDIDKIGMLFAQECQEEGHLGFAIRSTDGENVRLIGLQLPHHLVAKWLRAVADEYERQCRPRSLN